MHRIPFIPTTVLIDEFAEEQLMESKMSLRGSPSSLRLLVGSKSDVTAGAGASNSVSVW